MILYDIVMIFNKKRDHIVKGVDSIKTTVRHTNIVLVKLSQVLSLISTIAAFGCYYWHSVDPCKKAF